MMRFSIKLMVAVVGVSLIAAPAEAKGRKGRRSISNSSFGSNNFSSFSKRSFRKAPGLNVQNTAPNLNLLQKAPKLNVNRRLNNNLLSNTTTKRLSQGIINNATLKKKSDVTLKKLNLRKDLKLNLDKNLAKKAVGKASNRLLNVNARKLTQVGSLMKRMKGDSAVQSFVKKQGTVLSLKYGTKQVDWCCYKKKNCFHWSHWCYSKHYGCKCYYDPCWSCYYYWCEHDYCWYPIWHRCIDCFPHLVVVEQHANEAAGEPADTEAEALKARSLSDIPMIEDGDKLIEKSLVEQSGLSSLGETQMPIE